MKRYFSLLLALLLILSLCACRKNPVQTSPAADASMPAESPVPAETATVSPVLPAEAETISLMAGTMQKDAEGILWTSLTPLDDVAWVYDLLPADAGYVYSFLLDSGYLYAAVKDDSHSMDGVRLYAIHMETGEARLLAENGSGACMFCLVGDNTILYPSDTGGLWAIDIAAGTASEALPDALSLIAAQNGWFYYTKADNGLYRSDSTLLTEEKLLDTCPSYWVVTGTDSLCSLAYADENTALLEFRDLSGSLRSRQPLAESPSGLYTDGALVYVPQPAEGIIAIYDIASGEARSSIPLEAYEDVLILWADGDGIWYRGVKNGVFSLFRMNADGSGQTLLAENVNF